MSDFRFRQLYRRLTENPEDPYLVSQVYYALLRQYGHSHVNNIVEEIIRGFLEEIQADASCYMDPSGADTQYIPDEISPFVTPSLDIILDPDQIPLSIEISNEISDATADGDIYDGTEDPASIVETTIGNLLSLRRCISERLPQQPWFCGFGVTPLSFEATDLTAEYRFMQPQIVYDTWCMIESSDGTDYIPNEYVSVRDAVVEEIIESNPETLIDQDFINDIILRNTFEYKSNVDDLTDEELEIYEDLIETHTLSNAIDDFRDVDQVEVHEGFGARLSAPGYMDATDWSIFDTEQEAEEYLREEHPADSLPTTIDFRFSLNVCK